jgi:hypothetical protein
LFPLVVKFKCSGEVLLVVLDCFIRVAERVIAVPERAQCTGLV